jgi:hypothetical protein
MVFERIFGIKTLIANRAYCLYTGVIFTLISYIISFVLFHNPSVRNFIGISTILLTVILTLPLISSLFSYEEKYLTATKKGFLRKHKFVIDFFLYYFIGVFVVFFILALIFPTTVFSQDQLYGHESSIELVVEGGKMLPPPPTAGSETLMIFRNNFLVMIVCFFLSLFYGSGALFLIVLNASIFASALAKVIRYQVPAYLGFTQTYSLISCNLGIMFFHMIPEVSAYLMAAIAGGLLSKAILTERLSSQRFKRVIISSSILMGVATIFLFKAALIEVHVSKNLFMMAICNLQGFWVILIAVLIILGLVVLEFLRMKHSQ